MSTPDLITTAFATQAIQAGGNTLTTAQLAHLPNAISAASQAVGNWCGNRDFVRATYERIYTTSLDGRVLLDQIPVNRVLRVAGTRAQALVISASQSTYQRATAVFSTTGDWDSGLTITGLELDWIAGGTPGTTTLLFSAYPTIAALGAAVAALGFNVNVAPIFNLWPSTELVGGEVAQGLLLSATFDVFSEDLPGCRVDRDTGMLAVGFAGSRGIYGPMWGPDWQDDDPAMPSEGSQVHVYWDAGYTTVPLIVQQAVAEVTKAVLERLRADTTLIAENAGMAGYTQAANDAILLLPTATMMALSEYRRIRA